MQRNNREHLAEAIAGLPVFNHHDHAWSSFSRTHGQEFDLPYYLHRDYLAGDLAAAGLDMDPGTFEYLRDPRLPDGSEAAFRILRPFLDDA